MTTPKHRSAPGSSYFVTTKCWQGRTVFQVVENAQILIETLFHHRDKQDYLLHEFVVMPDHLHLLMTPNAATSLEKCVQLFKGGSSFRIRRARDLKMEIWQVSFYDWTIRDNEDWRAKVEYIRMNPVRAGLVGKPEEWKYSSAGAGFDLDSMPARYGTLASGAKAPIPARLTQGLKPLPPKESESGASDETEKAVEPENAGLGNLRGKVAKA
jgi:putative transposase